MEMAIRFNNFALTDFRIANMIGRELETDLIDNGVEETLIWSYTDNGISGEVFLIYLCFL